MASRPNLAASDALSQMVQALSLEIAAIRKKGGGARVELRGGEFAGRAEGCWLYRFVVAEELHLRDDSPVRLTAGQEDVPGTLMSFRDEVLVVALERDLGPKIASARLTTDDSFLIDRLMKRLEQVRNGECRFDRASAERALGLAPVRTAVAEPNAACLTGSPNVDQVRAVAQSLGSQAIFLWGPPGTGKTSTLARIAEAFYRAGRSVLLVSNTNIAVDTAVEKIAERLRGEPKFHEGLLIRHGPLVKEDLNRQWGEQVVLESVVNRLGRTLTSEKTLGEREAAELEGELQSLTAALSDMEEFAAAQAAVLKREAELETTGRDIASRQQEMRRHVAAAGALRTELERARQMSGVRRIFAGLSPEKLGRQVAVAERSAEAARGAAEALRNTESKLVQELLELQRETERLTSATRRHPPPPEIKARLATTGSRLNTLRARLTAIAGELAALETEVIANCRILATTVYRTYLKKSLQREFDVTIVDEASMLMPPMVYYAAGLASKSVVVAGDFRQLPPIVLSEEQLPEKWLKRDAFEVAAIPAALGRGTAPPYLVALSTQYRMRRDICDIVSDLFYPDHRLISDAKTDRPHPRLFPFGDGALFYVDTASFQPWTALRAGTFSRYNLFHALLIRNIVLHLNEAGYLSRGDSAADALGVVAPYASQSRLIHALISEKLGDRALGIAATVHRYQGNERDAMIVDLTDSAGAPLSRFLKATRIDEAGARLLNVAVSRARRHVILIANASYLRAKAPPAAYARRLFERFERNSKALSMASLLPIGERDWLDGLHQLAPGKFAVPEDGAGLFTEGTFYPAFLADLERAQRSVVILSPFLTARGAGRWADPLRAALVRGAHVTILTRPPDEPGGAKEDEATDTVRNLRALGLAVQLRARMHEKIAMIDQRVLWHGSLNILSHRDTHESMLRFKSEAACREFEVLLVPTSMAHGDGGPDLANPPCPKCGGATIWLTGRYGVFFRCERPGCDGKRDARTSAGSADRKRSKSASTARKRPPAGACPESGCGGRMLQRTGRYGPFLACSNYPRCRHTETLR